MTPLLAREGRLALGARADYARRAVTYGAVVAVARLAGTAEDALEDLSAAQRAWFCGPVGWVLADVVAIAPVPCRGAPGLWELPPEALAKVRAGYAAARRAGVERNDGRAEGAQEERDHG
jgi:hypothetical protein